MDMHIFQIKSNQTLPSPGGILIASPLLNDYHFMRSVVLLITHSEEGSMGIVMNKDFRYHISLNQLAPELEGSAYIPVFKGGPMEWDTIFFIHTLKQLKGALELGNGLYMNGDFKAVQQYILDGGPLDGHIRFFAGYAGWSHGQLQQEIQRNSWFIGKGNSERLLHDPQKVLWNNSMNDLGNPYTLWSKYPVYPSFN